MLRQGILTLASAPIGAATRSLLCYQPQARSMFTNPIPAPFSPIQVGDVKLGHRVVLVPLIRYRASDAHTPTDIVVEYYKQRASTPGSLLIAEATFIAPQASGYANVPGIWNEQQIAAWKKVHGCFLLDPIMKL